MCSAVVDNRMTLKVLAEH